jgi:mannose-6-phosphate isomerase-like protein (cupin superfamily)
VDTSPPPVSLARARALPHQEGRISAELLVDGDLEVRFYAPKGVDSQFPHDRDEIYFVAAGHGMVRVGDRVDPVAAGTAIFVAAHEEHRFEDFSDDFAVWVVFYGPVK